MISTTTANSHYGYQIHRTEYSAPRGTEFALVTITKDGLHRIEVYQTDPADGIEMFIQFINPDYIDETSSPENNVHGLLTGAILWHRNYLDSYGVTLTPMADWPVR